MRVLLAPDTVEQGDAVGAAAAAQALAHGWSAARPDDELVTHPLSAGGRGLLEALQASVGGEQEVAVVRDAWGEPVPATWLRAGRTGYVEAAPLLGEPSSAEAARLATGGSSAGVGELLLAVLRSPVTRVVVGLGEVGVHDAGLGALHALAGTEPGADLGEVVARAAAAVRGVELVVAAGVDRPLLGLSGAGAALADRPGIDAALAQQRELALASEVARVEAAAVRPMSLLGASGTERRGARRSHSGAGGGVAFALSSLGARLLPGADVVVAETGVEAAVEATDIVLTACSVLDGDALAIGVPGAVGRVAGRALVPAVGVAPQVRLGRRELAGTGLEAVYPLTDPPPPGQPPREVSLVDALSQRASRVARTWSR